MKAIIEISLYPLHQEYSQKVLDFIDQLRQHEEFAITTNELSTMIIGDYGAAMDMLKEEMEKILQDENAVFVLKVAAPKD